MKRLGMTFLFVVLLLTLFSSAAYASNNNTDKVNTMVERTNAAIDREIDKAAILADKAANDSEKVTAIINNLLQKTNEMTERLIDKAEKYGVAIEKYFIEVVIGGQTVLVDPCHVVGS